ncbi:MAG: hypothetical protein ACP5D9_12195 [Mariniphaga sp.]
MEITKAVNIAPGNEGTKNTLAVCREHLFDSLHQANIIYTLCLTGFLNEDLSTLKEARKLKKLLHKKQEKFSDKIFQTAASFENLAQTGHFYMHLNDYLKRMIGSLTLIFDPLYEHLNNSHKPFIKPQVDELNNLVNDINLLMSRIVYFIKNEQINDSESLTHSLETLNKNLERSGIEQIKRMKKKQVNTRNSILFLNILSETKNMLNNTMGLFQSYFRLATQLKNENPTKPENVIQ